MGSFRTTITVPQDLKAQMDAVKEDVNWSELACKAFEKKLAEIATKKARKTMKDVIQRLKASRDRALDERTKEGEEAGRRWARNKAEYDQLQRAAAFLEDPNTDELRTSEAATGLGDQFVFAMFPYESRDREIVEHFWGREVGMDDEFALNDANFVSGFMDGAVEVFKEVEKAL